MEKITSRNAMEISVKGLTLAVVVVIALMLSALSLYLVNKAKGTINDGSAQFSEVMDEYSELTTTLYDGMYVSGEKVIECIDEMTRDAIISVTVKTGMNEAEGTGNTYVGKEHAAGSKYDVGIRKERNSSDDGSPYDALGLSADSSDYINPSATFVGKVIRNANGMAVNITFVQK